LLNACAQAVKNKTDFSESKVQSYSFAVGTEPLGTGGIEQFRASTAC